MTIFLNSTLTLALACALVCNIGCNQPSVAQTSNPPGTTATIAALDRVTTGSPQRKELILTTSQPGRVEAFEETPLYSKLSAYVEEVLVDIGDEVQQDQVLIQLWAPEIQDEVAQHEALVAQAVSEVEQAQAAVDAAQAAAETAAAQVSLAEAGKARTDAQYERWETEYGRMKQLASNGSVTQKLADETQNQFRAADASRQETVAQVRVAEAAALGAKANVRKAQADLAAAGARQKVAEANLSKAKTQLAYTEIRAPFDGVVTQRGVDTRHFVQPSGGPAARPLMVVASTSTVRVFVDVPELEAVEVDSGETGDPVIVQAKSLGDTSLKAQVTRTSWALDRTNRSLRTEIDIPNSAGQLRPGMYVNVTIELARRSNALVIPATAIVRSGSETFCCCVVGGKIERRPIQLGLRSGPDIEILSGLDASQQVVLARAESLQPGQAVDVIAAKPKLREDCWRGRQVAWGRICMVKIVHEDSLNSGNLRMSKCRHEAAAAERVSFTRPNKPTAILDLSLPGRWSRFGRLAIRFLLPFDFETRRRGRSRGRT